MALTAATSSAVLPLAGQKIRPETDVKIEVLGTPIQQRRDGSWINKVPTINGKIPAIGDILTVPASTAVMLIGNGHGVRFWSPEMARAEADAKAKATTKG